MPQLLQNLRANLSAGFALAFFRRKALDDFHISVDQAVWLTLTGLLVEFGSDYYSSLPRPVFDSDGFGYFSLSLVLFILAGYFYSLLLKRRQAVGDLLVITFSATFVFYGLNLLLVIMGGYSSQLPVWVFQASTVFYFVWLVAVLLRALFVVAERRKWPVAAGFMILLAVWLAPTAIMNRSSFWYADYADNSGRDRYSAYRKMDAEALMYAQDGMLQRELAKLKPGRPGVTDLYFVGFAGYARQDVFDREVRYARNVMDKRYGTAGRSLLFINNLKSRNDYPLATATNLQRALKALASVMDDEDVLMLYLTSHGSKRHKLAVDFWPLPLNDITPEALRKMLDDAGIAWRVVIVSACYSGGFVDSLKEEHTFVATAAAPDRTSFGCSNERDFTYYGEALFKDELPHSDSLLGALRHTPLTISRRERLEKLEPSRPQLYFTPAVEKKLQGIRRVECSKDEAEKRLLSC